MQINRTTKTTKQIGIILFILIIRGIHHCIGLVLRPTLVQYYGFALQKQNSLSDKRPLLPFRQYLLALFLI